MSYHTFLIIPKHIIHYPVLYYPADGMFNYYPSVRDLCCIPFPFPLLLDPFDSFLSFLSVEVLFWIVFLYSQRRNPRSNVLITSFGITWMIFLVYYVIMSPTYPLPTYLPTCLCFDLLIIRPSSFTV